MQKNKKILITGGAGYIGSHMVRLLLEKGYCPVVFDNLSTGYRSFVPKGVPFVRGDLRKSRDIDKLFKKYKFYAVMHFAASTILPESLKKPMKYYNNNVIGSLNLIKFMLFYDVDKIIFSSTAAVYGEPRRNPVKETYPAKPTNPYGISKLVVEQALDDVSKKSNLSYIAFRYFNVAGAHPSEEVGPTLASQQSLIPVVMRDLKDRKSIFTLFGDDYKTPDGTCIRDYIYVMDLCEAHCLALKAFSRGIKNQVFNLGNETGFSVKEVITAAEKITKRKIKVKIGKRRPGDMPKVVASSEKFQKLLGWKNKATLSKILQTAWKWEKSLVSKRL